MPITLMEGLLTVTVGAACLLSLACLRGKNRYLLLPLMVAFFLRGLLAVAHRIWNIVPDGRVDAVTFERTAWEWAQSGCGNTLQHLDLGASYVHSWIVANIYACTDRAPLLFQMINVVLGVGVVYLVARLTLLVWGHQAALRSAWIAAIFPALVMYSSVALREVWFAFFLILGVYWFIAWMENRKLTYFLGGLLALVCASVFHGGAVFAILSIAVAISIFATKETVRTAITGRVRYAPVLAFLILITGFVALSSSLDQVEFSSIGDVQQLGERFAKLDQLTANYGAGGAAYPVYLIPTSTGDFIWQTPVRMVYLLVGPPPWEVKSVSLALGMVDGLFYLVLLFLLWKYRAQWWSRPEIRVLFFITLALVFVYAWGTSNFGTGMRHRAKFVILMIVMVAGLLGSRDPCRCAKS